MSSIRVPSLPADTARATEAAFGNEHPYLKIGQRLEEVLFNLDIDFLASIDQALANSLWPYALATILQYWEDLTDFQMVNATRTRLDLKYAMHLTKDFPGIDPTALCAFRQQLRSNQAGRDVLQKIINRLAAFSGNPEQQSATVDVILASTCIRRQWEIVMETMSNAIESLAATQPEWLRSIALPHWFKRYGKRKLTFDSKRTSKNIKSIILAVAQDGQYLLNAAEQSGLTNVLQMSELQMVAQVWQSLFKKEGDKLGLNATSCSSCPGRIEFMSAKSFDHE